MESVLGCTLEQIYKFQTLLMNSPLNISQFLDKIKCQDQGLRGRFHHNLGGDRERKEEGTSLRGNDVGRRIRKKDYE